MPSHLTAGLLAALGPLALAGSPAAAHDTRAGDLAIQQPWSRATPGGAQVAGGYVTILNKGASPDRLLGGSLQAASGFELHDMSMAGDVMQMRPAGPQDIPPGGELRLAPSGKHIMFTGLKRSLRKGETIDGTLVFERAGTVPVRFEVEGMGARAPAKDDPGHAGHAMPGMDMD